MRGFRSHAKQDNKHNGGFTLVEMLVSIAILVILMAMLMPALTSMRKKTMIDTTRKQIQTIYIAIESYKQDVGYYPPPQTASGYVGIMDDTHMLDNQKVLEHFKYSDDNIENGKYVDSFGKPIRYIAKTTADAFRDEANQPLQKMHPAIFIYSCGLDADDLVTPANAGWNSDPTQEYDTAATPTTSSDNIWVQTAQ